MKKLLPLLTLLLLALLSCSPAVPAVPALLSADAGEKSVSLSWGTAEGAEFYRIYRDDGGTGVFKFIDDTTAGEYTDSCVKGGMTYVYKVCAVAGKNESDGAVSGAVYIYADNESPAAVLSVPSIIFAKCSLAEIRYGASSVPRPPANLELSTVEGRTLLSSTPVT